MGLFGSNSSSEDTEDDDLTVLSEIGQSRADSLIGEGYDSYRSLAEATPEELSKVDSITEQLAKYFINQARLLETDEAYTPHNSVDEDAMLTIKNSQEKPLISRLKNGEKPLFVFYTRLKSPVIDGDRFDKINNQNGITHLITNQRWLSIAGQKDGEETLEILFDEINSVSYKTGIWKHKVVFGVNDSKVTLPLGNLQTGGDVEIFIEYLLTNYDIEEKPEIPDIKSQSSVSDSTENDSSKDSKNEDSGKINPEPPVILVPEDDSRSNTLTIPTRSNEAKFSSKGWSLGDTVRRNTSKGKIEEEPFEEFFYKLILGEDQVEIGISDRPIASKTSRKLATTFTEYIDIDEIEGVKKENRRGNHLFIIETYDDSFQFQFSKRNDKNEDLIDSGIHYLEGAINRNTQTNTNTGENTTEDNFDKLERLADLNEKGILSDEEFEEKKSELLDDI